MSANPFDVLLAKLDDIEQKIAALGPRDLWIDVATIERDYAIPARTTCRLIREGALEAAKVGREYTIRRASIDAYLAAHRVAPVSAPTVDDADPALGAALSKARAKTLQRAR